MTKRALVILTSADQMGDTGNKTGFFWEELAVPYWALRDAGYAVDLASVAGGEPPADPSSDGGEGQRPEEVQRFMDDADAMAKLKDTAPIGDVDAASYDALFLPGGHGTMWDFRQSKAVGDAVSTGFDGGAVVGAVCHGPSGLLGATLSNGDPIIKGRRVSGFTNTEEEAVGLTGVVPFLLEDELRALGGVYEKADDDFAAFALRDGRLVTGQNPASSAKVAALMLEALEEKAAQAA